jgi:hypothetical protein
VVVPVAVLALMAQAGQETHQVQAHHKEVTVVLALDSLVLAVVEQVR